VTEDRNALEIEELAQHRRLDVFDEPGAVRKHECRQSEETLARNIVIVALVPGATERGITESRLRRRIGRQRDECRYRRTVIKIHYRKFVLLGLAVNEHAGGKTIDAENGDVGLRQNGAEIGLTHPLGPVGLDLRCWIDLQNFLARHLHFWSAENGAIAKELAGEVLFTVFVEI